MWLITVLELRSLKLVPQSSQATERCPPLGQARGLAGLHRARRGSGARGPSSRGVAPAPRPRPHLLLAARFHSPNASSGVHLLPLQGPLLTLRPCHNSPPLSTQGLPCEETYLQVRGGGVLIQSTTQDPINLLVCRYWRFTHCRDGVRKITL